MIDFRWLVYGQCMQKIGLVLKHGQIIDIRWLVYGQSQISVTPGYLAQHTYTQNLFCQIQPNIAFLSFEDLQKKMNFPKIWRLWLKNCARHAHFNFELLKGVAVSFFKLYPSNFSHACIFYRQTNDVFTAKLYL